MFDSIKDKIMFCLARVFIFVIDMVIFSCRITTEGLELAGPHMKRQPYLLASWHGRLILYFFGPRSEKPGAMASRSRDGYLASLLQEAGRYVVFRGSSRKGGMEALIQMQKYMKKWNRSGKLSVDGPTGPMYVVKPGVVYLAAAMSYPIIPMSFSAKKMKTMRSWDRLMIPYPFTECTVIYGKPFFVPKNPSEEMVEKITQELQDELRRITEVADGRYGHCIEPLIK